MHVLLLAALGLALVGSQEASPSADPVKDERAQDEAASPYAAWKRGPPTDPAWFTIGVWLQDPALAERYRELGVNTFVGLWQGPTEEQLAALKAAGMRALCAQNEVGLAWRADPTIIGWLQIDEPDNREKGDKENRPRASPAEALANYARLRAADPERPVWLNLGQGVANDTFKGRAATPADYPRYAKACDILSFDVYPVTNIQREDGENFLWFVAKGLERLREWGGAEKIRWNFVECTRVSHPTKKATSAQVEAEVWMSLVHGSRGIVYFCHEFQPNVNADALLDDPEMCAAVARIDARVLALAPVLNSPTLDGEVSFSAPGGPREVGVLVKRHAGALYVLTVGMRNAPTEATFVLKSPGSAREVEVLDEGRTLALEDGTFRDAYGPYAVHLYRIEERD
jgi:hypothetical protein